MLRSLDEEVGLNQTKLGHALATLCTFPHTNRPLLPVIASLEGGTFYSYNLRRILLQRHGVYGGAYSYGQWTRPGAMPHGTVIGRYVSMAKNVVVLSRNHPYERLSMAPYFYDASLGYVGQHTIQSATCTIGHDAWIGYSAILTPGCSRIGIGAVVGAGAVVTKDVPDFAIVAGNPAKLLKYRFDESIRKRILDSRWWERSLDELLPYIKDLSLPFEELPSSHPLLVKSAI